MGLSQSSASLQELPEYSWVTERIGQDNVVVFSKSTCPYCRVAKNLLDSNQIKYAVYEVNTMENCNTLQDVLAEITGARTVPRIFINGESIGGCDDLKRLNSNGKLKELVQAEDK